MANDNDATRSTGAPVPNAKVSQNYDLMRPGNGTPWEDRGTFGPVAAYFKTAFKSIVSPGLLLDHIRRPETTADASSFAIISGVMWAVGWIALKSWQYYGWSREGSGYDITGGFNFALTVVAECAVIGGGVWLFVNAGTKLIRNLTAGELRSVTSSLIYNIFCYCLGPSLLAVVPIYGQGLAIILIFVNLLVAGRKRLYLKTSSVVVNTIILFLCTVAIGVAVYYIIGWLWGGYFNMSGVEKNAPVKVAAPPV
ncbi:MAG TPA: hypothetical protein VFC78_14855 [Tepidisphaeraceae bacterium]|nr:hypothetical protein [Tepidisphaeraceae bacterium]